MTDKNLYCSFCGKSQHEVSKLIAGPTVFICDECVDLCRMIVGEKSFVVGHRTMIAADLGVTVSTKWKAKP